MIIPSEKFILHCLELVKNQLPIELSLINTNTHLEPLPDGATLADIHEENFFLAPMIAESAGDKPFIVYGFADQNEVTNTHKGGSSQSIRLFFEIGLRDSTANKNASKLLNLQKLCRYQTALFNVFHKKPEFLCYGHINVAKAGDVSYYPDNNKKIIRNVAITVSTTIAY